LQERKNRNLSKIKRRKKISPKIKNELIEEAGGKCANPGCSDYNLHLHHIKHWSVYQCDDPDHMIALCPSCHDDVHRGQLKIPDETLYLWKQKKVNNKQKCSYLHIEPSTDLKLLTGSVSIKPTQNKQLIFELANGSNLALRVLNNKRLQINATIYDQEKCEILKVTENHVDVEKEGVELKQRKGRIQITVETKRNYIPEWVIFQMRKFQRKDFGKSDRIKILDIEVIKPGFIKIEGIWANNEKAVIITNKELIFCPVPPWAPTNFVGAGEKTVFTYDGPISTGMFDSILHRQ